MQNKKIIVNSIETSISVIENFDKTLKNSFITLKNLRQSILKYAFEGKLVPQDPNDEPAEILLERIKRERESTYSN